MDQRRTDIHLGFFFVFFAVFLSRVRQALHSNNGVVSKLGDVLLTLAASMKIYPVYVAYYDAMLEVLSFSGKSSKLSSWIKDIESQLQTENAAEDVSFTSLITLPVRATQKKSIQLWKKKEIFIFTSSRS
jgi:hypothetical protein